MEPCINSMCEYWEPAHQENCTMISYHFCDCYVPKPIMEAVPDRPSMDIEDIKMAIQLTAKNIKRSLADLQTILESEGLSLRSVDVGVVKVDISTFEDGGPGSKTKIEIQTVNIDVAF